MPTIRNTISCNSFELCQDITNLIRGNIMAQSMFEIIESGRIEVNHNGEDVWFDVPEVLTNAAGKLEKEEQMLEWIKEVGALKVGHAAISDMIIDLRANIRPTDVKDATGKKVKASLITDQDNAQERADNWLPKAKTRPGSGSQNVKTKAEIDTLTSVVRAMLAGGLTSEQIHAMQDPVFGKVKVALAINNAEI